MAQTEEQLQLAENAAEELGLGSVQEAKETLSTKTLSSQPDFAIQEGDTPTAGAALEGAVQAETDAFTEELSRQRKEAEKPVEESRSEIQDILAGIRGETGLQAEAEKEVGLPDVEKELLDINQQLRTEQNALRREIEAIEKNTAGRSAGQVANKIDEVRTESIRKQADLTVIQMGIQGRYDSAKAIADRAVQAQMEKQEMVYQTALFNYQENKELYTKAEQREFEALASNRKAEIESKKETEKAIKNFAIQALMDGAPTATVMDMMQAETEEEALSIGGSYIGSLDRAIKQRQYEKLGLELDSEKDKIDAALKAREEGVLSPEQFKVAVDLRKEVNNLAEVKDAKNLEPNMAALLVALDQENGVGDISAINTFQRLAVDPGVAVREGDVALLQSAQSFTDQATLRAQGLLVGDKLTDDARKQMREVAKGVYRIRVELVDENTKPIRTMAQEQGIDYGKYIGKNFASFEELESRVNKDDAIVFGINTTTDNYVDNIFTTLSADPTANPFGINLSN